MRWSPWPLTSVAAQFVLPAELPQFLAELGRAPTGPLVSPAVGPLTEADWHGRRWLLKSQAHRGVHLMADLTEAKATAAAGKPARAKPLAVAESAAVFAAQYIEPLLIDSRKWDLGMYVLVTSLDPLVVHVYDNVLLRFCELPYPAVLDASSKTQSYVVVDYLPPWEQPSLRPLFAELPSSTSEGTNALAVLEQHMRLQPERTGLPAAAGMLRGRLRRACVAVLAGNAGHMREQTRVVTGAGDRSVGGAAGHAT